MTNVKEAIAKLEDLGFDVKKYRGKYYLCNCSEVAKRFPETIKLITLESLNKPHEHKILIHDNTINIAGLDATYLKCTASVLEYFLS